MFGRGDMWVFPKIGVKPPKSSILIGLSNIFTIHFGGTTIFGNTHVPNVSFLWGVFAPLGEITRRII